MKIGLTLARKDDKNCSFYISQGLFAGKWGPLV